MLRSILLLAAVLVLGGPSAAQQAVQGSQVIPRGNWQYRWRSIRDTTGQVTRDTVRGYLRLHENRRLAHSRSDRGELNHTTGGYDPQSDRLRLLDIENGQPKTVDFTVRHIGRRLYLWTDSYGEFREYVLERAGAPAAAAPAPGVVPGVEAEVSRIALFAAAGSVAPPRAQRAYADHFAAGTTPYLFAELLVRHPMAPEAASLAITCAWLRPDSTVLAESVGRVAIVEGNTRSYATVGVGPFAEGAPARGRYQLRCRAGDVAFGEKSFDIL